MPPVVASTALSGSRPPRTAASPCVRLGGPHGPERFVRSELIDWLHVVGNVFPRSHLAGRHGPRNDENPAFAGAFSVRPESRRSHSRAALSPQDHTVAQLFAKVDYRRVVRAAQEARLDRLDDPPIRPDEARSGAVYLVSDPPDDASLARSPSRTHLVKQGDKRVLGSSGPEVSLARLAFPQQRTRKLGWFACPHQRSRSGARFADALTSSSGER